ncbi:FimB/Mfa2 family fimbrial subunit [Bacteroides sp. 224]|uniref:FimB/Mfa2 family fimbrial subunit n=1 Tax=Bacteroides sp. 224 TaxID=2302936 RepID=UPI0013D23A00|nr:FimB/Mfa2 family fimbrial subunit [Bacteroides sp. 224]NDV66501.1 hypothetical protein [Bacteroides sp. 224]
MKLLKILSLFTLLSGLCISCDSIGDNLDDCGMYVNLYFEYPKFPERIHRVNVGIINKDNGQFVRVRNLSKKYLIDYQGIRTRLMPGNYMAVCWGNAFDKTTIGGLDFDLPAEDHWVKHPKFIAWEDPLALHEQIQTNDSLFYGRHTFEIPEMYGVYNDTVHYRPAHITFEVYVHGLESTLPQKPTDNYPFVTFNNLRPYYDYEMETLGDYVSYYPTMEVDTDMVMASCTTKVLRFTNENPIEIVIDEPQVRTHPEIPYTIDVKQLLHGRLDLIEEDKEYIIKIGVYFNGLGVEVKLLGWIGQGTETPID